MTCGPSRGCRSYRVALLRREPRGELNLADIEYVRVKANNAVHAMLAARHVTGAVIAMEAERVVA